MEISKEEAEAILSLINHEDKYNGYITPVLDDLRDRIKFEFGIKNQNI